MSFGRPRSSQAQSYQSHRALSDSTGPRSPQPMPPGYCYPSAITQSLQTGPTSHGAAPVSVVPAGHICIDQAPGLASVSSNLSSAGVQSANSRYVTHRRSTILLSQKAPRSQHGFIPDHDGSGIIPTAAIITRYRYACPRQKISIPLTLVDAWPSRPSQTHASLATLDQSYSQPRSSPTPDGLGYNAQNEAVQRYLQSRSVPSQYSTAQRDQSHITRQVLSCTVSAGLISSSSTMSYAYSNSSVPSSSPALSDQSFVPS